MEQFRYLGQTDIAVTPIGLGVMQFAGGKGVFGMMMPRLSQTEMNGIVRAALDGGINWFDTAEMYGRGRSERALATALQAAGRTDDQVVVATKWLPILRTAGNIPRTIDERLRCLNGYGIDLYMVHQPWSFSAPEAEMEAMVGLVQAGQIRSVGVSNFSADQMRRAHAILARYGLPLAVNQVRYSLLHREIERNGVLDTARELGVTIVAYTPLGYGLLTEKLHRDPQTLQRKPWLRRLRLQRQLAASRPIFDALAAIAARHGVTPAQAALNWLIHFHGKLVVAIPGASRASQATENAGAMAFTLTPEELAQLEAVSRAGG